VHFVVVEVMMRKDIPTAEKLMNTALRTADVGQDIEDVQLDMKMAEIHHLPVLNDKHCLVGIVTARAVAEAMTNKELARKPVELIMEREVVTVPPTMPADAVIKLMIDKRISCVPVIEDDGTLCGILTETDFLHLALAHVREKRHSYSEESGYRR